MNGFSSRDFGFILPLPNGLRVSVGWEPTTYGDLYDMHNPNAYQIEQRVKEGIHRVSALVRRPDGSLVDLGLNESDGCVEAFADAARVLEIIKLAEAL
jgi:hypothetical protein